MLPISRSLIVFRPRVVGGHPAAAARSQEPPATAVEAEAKPSIRRPPMSASSTRRRSSGMAARSITAKRAVADRRSPAHPRKAGSKLSSATAACSTLISSRTSICSRTSCCVFSKAASADGRARRASSGRANSVRIDTPSGWVRVTEPGDYRISLLGPGGDRLDVELMVLRGSAEPRERIGGDRGACG